MEGESDVIGEEAKGAVRASGLDLLIGILDLPALAAESVLECERMPLGDDGPSKSSGLLSSLPEKASEVSILGRLLLGSNSERPSRGS